MSGLIHVGSYDGIEYVNDPRSLVLIEPQAVVFRGLVERFGARENVILRNVAIGSAPGTATMRIATFRPSSSLLQPVEHLELYPETRFNEVERVQVDTLDNVMADIGGVYDALVIDTQGYERHVLRGAAVTLEHINHVKIEVNTVEMFRGCPLLGELDAWFAERRFARTDLDLLSEGGRGCWGDAIYQRQAWR